MPSSSAAPKKGILRKEGVDYAKKSLVFKEQLIEAEPAFLSQPDYLTENHANQLEQENFREVWSQVTERKLNYAARKLQKFARKHMLCWIIVNDRRTELYEELEAIQYRLKVDLDFLQWEKEDMQQEADLEVQAERENSNCPPGQVNQVQLDITTIRELQQEIRQLKQENQQLKVDSKSLKKNNKRLQWDFKEKTPGVEIAKVKVGYLQDKHRKIKRNHDQFPPNVRKWQDSYDQMNAQLEQCQKQSKLYKECCLKALEEVKARYPRKRVLKPIMEIFHADFANHGPVPDGEVPKAPAFQRSATTGSARVGRGVGSPKKNRPSASSRRASTTDGTTQRSAASTPSKPTTSPLLRQSTSPVTPTDRSSLDHNKSSLDSSLLHDVAEEAENDEEEVSPKKKEEEEKAVENSPSDVTKDESSEKENQAVEKKPANGVVENTEQVVGVEKPAKKEDSEAGVQEAKPVENAAAAEPEENNNEVVGRKEEKENTTPEEESCATEKFEEETAESAEGGADEEVVDQAEPAAEAAEVKQEEGDAVAAPTEKAEAQPVAEEAGDRVEADTKKEENLQPGEINEPSLENEETTAPVAEPAASKETIPQEEECNNPETDANHDEKKEEEAAEEKEEPPELADEEKVEEVTAEPLETAEEKENNNEEPVMEAAAREQPEKKDIEEQPVVEITCEG